jgi:hypothetical protein
MDDLLPIADANGGCLMRHQLNDLGISDTSIRALRRDGQLVRIRHGTYAVAARWQLLSPAERLRVRTFSVLDKLGPGIAASHHSASVAHGFDLWGDGIDADVHITHLDGRPGRHEAGVVHHHGRLDPATELVTVEGRLVTAPMRAVFESASIATIESGMVLASSALRGGGFSKDELVDVGRTFDHWLGTRTARVAIRLADGRLETVGEARSLHMMWRHGLPHPELQHVLVDRHGRQIARNDFAWLEFRHLGEFDGLVKYGRLNPYATDPGRSIVDEKIREDLCRDQDLGMSRWVWAGLEPRAQSATAAMIGSAMERSRRLYLRNGTVIPLS